LIAYLRDLLVFKVKPDAVADDLNPELRAALESQSRAIETDRLLELIDQFAGAEGRMKWAPNKRLHFEVAVIKAIQTLDQVTLNEVIESLSALREGKPNVTPPGRSEKLPVRSAPPVSGPAGIPVGAGKTDAKPSARAAEKPAAEEKSSSSSGRSEGAAQAGNTSVDLEALWQKAVDQIRARRPLIKGWIDSAKVLGQEGRSFLLGFPPEQKAAMESIAMPRNRDFVESLLKEISGRDWSVKFSLKEGLVVQAPNHEETNGESGKSQNESEAAAKFKDDPLIREALELFQGEIKP